jgi:co-chaperonin GroES (HSP10)
MNTMTEILRPLNDDLILKRCNNPCDAHENGSAIIQVKREKDDANPWFDVIAVGKTATCGIKPGDKVMIPLMQHTLPFDWDGELLVATSEKEVLLVWDSE